ncbi:O-antigen ligase family protein, partial [Neisseria chenwenguii]|uniref:O-antigen ligase family protein n=1 Tax=Neisseria chenwenguii TaxID=1853278 RepID=UPI002D7A19B7
MMFQKFSDGSSSVWNERFLPLWFCFIWINIAPFLSLYRTGPLSSFYLEAGSLTGAALLVLVTAYCGLLNVKFSAAAKCLLVLAAFWWAQARLMNLTYPGMNDMVVWTFIILALAAWACRGWIAEYGQERAVTIFAWTLLFGALAQAVIAVLQFNGLSGTGLLRGITAYANKDGISGQLGQRNHLGHYLMWGTLSAAYLWAQRKMPAWLGFLLVAGLAGVMGLVNSRTILTYVIGVGLLLPFWRWRAGREANRLTAVMLFAVLAVFFFQFSMGHILEWLGNGSYETAVERVGTSSFEGSARQIEAKKAWLAFQTAPFFGHGWNSYALQSFLVNAEQQNYANNILGVLFTHAHNIVLNLLAEMGLVGTLLVAACILTAVWRMLSRPNHPASLLLLATMTVSMCHSMLEYPLWYIYFLTPFCLMLSLSPAQQQDVSDGLMQAKLRNLGGGLLALGIIAGILQLGWTYTNLTEYSQQQKTDTAVKIQQKISGLKQ